jgi:predicted RNA-binding protein YlqC (UPF0109 family)
MSDKQTAQLFYDIARWIVCDVDALTVETFAVGDGFDLVIVAGPADVGRLIGSGGSRFKAFKNLLRFISAKTETDYFLRRIPENDGAYVKVERKQQLTPDEAGKLSVELCKAIFKDDHLVTGHTEVTADQCLVTVSIGTRESLPVLRLASSILSELMEAAGLASGLTVRTLISPENPPQPGTADGRHAPEVSR